MKDAISFESDVASKRHEGTFHDKCQKKQRQQHFSFSELNFIESRKSIEFVEDYF